MGVVANMQVLYKGAVHPETACKGALFFMFLLLSVVGIKVFY